MKFFKVIGWMILTALGVLVLYIFALAATPGIMSPTGQTYTNYNPYWRTFLRRCEAERIKLDCKDFEYERVTNARPDYRAVGICQVYKDDVIENQEQTCSENPTQTFTSTFRTQSIEPLTDTVRAQRQLYERCISEAAARNCIRHQRMKAVGEGPKLLAYGTCFVDKKAAYSSSVKTRSNKFICRYDTTGTIQIGFKHPSGYTPENGGGPIPIEPEDFWF